MSGGGKLDYEPAPVARSMAAALAILARLDGVALAEVTSQRACDDCGKTGTTRRLGRSWFCCPCLRARHRVAREATS